jgi:hypothetical protein
VDAAALTPQESPDAGPLIHARALSLDLHALAVRGGRVLFEGVSRTPGAALRVGFAAVEPTGGFG